MASSNSIAISPASLGVQAGGPAAQTTTKRALILKQIETLQKQLTGLYKQLQALAGKSDPAAIQERIQLQQEIEGVEKEIKALQDELLQKSSDEKVQVPKTKKAADPASTNSASGSGNADPAAAAAPAAAVAPAAPSNTLSTVGSVINTQA